MKKFVTLVLALAMVLSLGVTAFAKTDFSDLETDLTTDLVTDFSKDATTVLEGLVQTATIRVVVPGEDKIIYNPLGLEFNVEDYVTGKTDQVITRTQYITNMSNVKLNFKAAAKAEHKGNARIVTDTTGLATETEDLLIKLDLECVGLTAKSEPDWKTVTDVKKSAIKEATPTASDFTSVDMEAAKGSTYSYAAFHVTGETSSAPNWKDSDGADVTVTMKFTPVAANTGNTGDDTPKVTPGVKWGADTEVLALTGATKSVKASATPITLTAVGGKITSLSATNGTVNGTCKVAADGKTATIAFNIGGGRNPLVTIGFTPDEGEAKTIQVSVTTTA